MLIVLAVVLAMEAGEVGTDARPGGSGEGRTMRPHVRRAHWHTFLTGPRSGEQTPILKWLPPIPINVDNPGELPVVVRDVE